MTTRNLHDANAVPVHSLALAPHHALAHAHTHAHAHPPGSPRRPRHNNYMNMRIRTGNDSRGPPHTICINSSTSTRARTLPRLPVPPSPHHSRPALRPSIHLPALGLCRRLLVTPHGRARSLFLLVPLSRYLLTYAPLALRLPRSVLRHVRAPAAHTLTLPPRSSQLSHLSLSPLSLSPPMHTATARYLLLSHVLVYFAM